MAWRSHAGYHGDTWPSTGPQDHTLVCACSDTPLTAHLQMELVICLDNRPGMVHDSRKENYSVLGDTSPLRNSRTRKVTATADNIFSFPAQMMVGTLLYRKILQDGRGAACGQSLMWKRSHLLPHSFWHAAAQKEESHVSTMRKVDKCYPLWWSSV